MSFDGIIVHPAASLFPLLAEVELAALAQDIKERGLVHELVFDQSGRLVDGRNRWLACKRAGVEPRRFECVFEDDADAARFVISENLKRRHLSESQRAMLGAKLEKEFFAPAAKERQRKAGEERAAQAERDGAGQMESVQLPANLPEAGKEPTPQKGRDQEARAQAAAAVNVSARSVSTAKKVIEKGVPELQDAVKAGQVTVSAAAEVAELPKEKQVEIVKAGPKEVRQTASDLRQAKKVAPATSNGNGNGNGSTPSDPAEHAWNKAFKELRMIMMSVEHHGGIENFSKSWPTDVCAKICWNLQQMRGQMDQWIAHFTGDEDVQSQLEACAQGSL